MPRLGYGMLLAVQLVMMAGASPAMMSGGVWLEGSFLLSGAIRHSSAPSPSPTSLGPPPLPQAGEDEGAGAAAASRHSRKSSQTAKVS